MVTIEGSSAPLRYRILFRRLIHNHFVILKKRFLQGET